MQTKFAKRKRTLKSTLLILLFFACFYPGDAKAEESLSITISKGIQMVLKDSRLIKVALPEKDMAYQESFIKRSELLPSLNANISQTFNRNQPGVMFGSSVVDTAEKSYYSYGFDVYQTLFDFGKSLSNYKASKELIKASQAHIDSIRRVAILEFIISYFNVLESEKMIAVAEKETDSLESYLNDIGHLYEQGSAVKNDLLPAQVRLADAKQKLISARSARETAVARLNNILALPLRTKISVQDMAMELEEVPELESAWSVAEEQRPELAFYEDQIKASDLTARAKSVENFPNFYADAGYSFVNDRFLANKDNAKVTLGATMKFYDGGLARAEVFKERDKQKQFKEEKDKLAEDIKYEIEDSYLSLNDAREKVLVAKEALSQAEENVRVYRAKYSAGAATTTDVLEAITLETRAQTNYHSSDYDLKRSYAKLMYSTGIDLVLLYETMERKNEHAKQ